MGRYRKGRYYRGRDDAELQWLEDGVGLIGRLFVFSALSLFVGTFQLIREFFKILAGQSEA